MPWFAGVAAAVKLVILTKFGLKGRLITFAAPVEVKLPLAALEYSVMLHPRVVACTCAEQVADSWVLRQKLALWEPNTQSSILLQHARKLRTTIKKLHRITILRDVSYSLFTCHCTIIHITTCKRRATSNRCLGACQNTDVKHISVFAIQRVCV